MTGGAQARLRPPLIPLFPREIKDEKRNEGKREEHVKYVKRKPKTFSFPLHFAYLFVSLQSTNENKILIEKQDGKTI